MLPKYNEIDLRFINIQINIAISLTVAKYQEWYNYIIGSYHLTLPSKRRIIMDTEITMSFPIIIKMMSQLRIPNNII